MLHTYESERNVIQYCSITLLPAVSQRSESIEHVGLVLAAHDGLARVCRFVVVFQDDFNTPCFRNSSKYQVLLVHSSSPYLCEYHLFYSILDHGKSNGGGKLIVPIG